MVPPIKLFKVIFSQNFKKQGRIKVLLAGDFHALTIEHREPQRRDSFVVRSPSLLNDSRQDISTGSEGGVLMTIIALGQILFRRYVPSSESR
ncbi:hypothetical protein AVEN_269835-1 [Araneus ventricosus]|uniref:Uncharacterized protein n=1 Tax=Araneus ventricosus TaxID=182803 RepID=A0A4Y2CHW0_ARAVE|nr:hypothetical protein AVEN_269835-1 [Araneus ventricosus]